MTQPPSLPSTRTPNSGPGRSFSVLRHRDFRLLWGAELVSTLGTQMQRVAIAWQVYEISGDALSLGFLGLARFGPVVLFGLLGGVMADQRDRRRLLVMTQSTLLAISALLALLSFDDRISLGVIYGATFVAASVAAISGPSRQALIPVLVPRAEIVGAMSLNVLAMQVATVSGPAIGGWLIAQWSVTTVYLVDAASFLVVIAAVLAMRARPASGGITMGTFAAVVQGFGFLRGSPILLGVMSVDFVATFFGASTVLMPLFAEEILDVGPRGLGLLLAAPAAGAVVGSVLMSVAPMPRRPGAGVVVAAAIYGGAVAIFGLSELMWLSLVALAGGGLADAISMALRHTIRNLVTPDHLRGRIAATHSMFAMGGPQLGEFEAGLAASSFGAGPSVAFGGIATVVSAAAIAYLIPSIRRYRTS